MLRAPLFSLCIAVLFPVAAFADTVTADLSITAATVYPQGATVTRVARFEATAGTHQVLVPSLPQGLRADAIRILPAAGVTIGARSLATGRLPVLDAIPSAEVQAAEDEIARLEQVLREGEAEVARIRLRAEAALAQASILPDLAQAGMQAEPTDAAIPAMRALAAAVGQDTLTLRETALVAEQDAATAERALDDTRDALEQALQTLAARAPDANEGSVLTLSLALDAAGPVMLLIETFENEAAWVPTYEMSLTTGDAPTIMLDRSVAVWQGTGRDWNDIALTLSTVSPGGQTAPKQIWPQRRMIVSEADIARQKAAEMQDSGNFGGLAPEALEAPVVISDSVPATMALNRSGVAIVYDYPSAVTIRGDVDALQLKLDRLSFDVETWAEAVPAQDKTAFRMARLTNTASEVLLPGQASLLLDGTLVGFTELPVIVAGAKEDIGFGPINDIRLEWTSLEAREGDVGILTRGNERSEAAQLTVNNYSDRDWTIVLRDSIPYSEQDDLVITYKADPAATRISPDNARGMLEWDLTVPAGATQKVTVSHRLSWPDGYQLR